MICLSRLSAPIGTLTVHADDQGILAIRLHAPDEPLPPEAPNELTRLARAQLSEYFQGTRRVFTLPLTPAPDTTPFRRAVWEAVSHIPYGYVATYREIAETIGHPRACRAVGSAVKHNPFLLVVPCHRVLAVGSPGGYTAYGGLDTKRWLLQWEKEHHAMGKGRLSI